MTKRYLRYAGTGLACTAALAAVISLPVISNAASSHVVPADVQAFIDFEQTPTLPESAGAKFAALHLETTATQRDEIALSGMPQLRYSKIVKADATGAQRKCMAQAVYYEARSETLAGQKAVTEVVINRISSKHYPDTVCGVIYQGSERSTGCQFSFTCDGSLNKKTAPKAWRRAQRIADYALSGVHHPMTEGATHYHTLQINPVWSGSLMPTRRIGSHQFYRMKTRREISRDRVLAP
ncbi:cell wall hydrolase [Robiginitomaculum antarcticum]|uniref:cell wall hydrolase n=1 Tax=Robiginitomaculum antarcticum TaxID=437507 RepID=UPI00039C88B4|nr:cell wall hydrolase [Robiginitomaculum antarcticum]